MKKFKILVAILVALIQIFLALSESYVSVETLKSNKIGLKSITITDREDNEVKKITEKNTENSSTLTKTTSKTKLEKIIQEFAYAYYMRGRNIQYSTRKGYNSGCSAPEEATSQNMNYTTCSAFIKKCLL